MNTNNLILIIWFVILQNQCGKTKRFSKSQILMKFLKPKAEKIRNFNAMMIIGMKKIN
jgi:hypothetical protein